MTVRTYPAYEKSDTADFFDFLLVFCTLGLEVGSVAVENVDVFFGNIYVAEEVIPSGEEPVGSPSTNGLDSSGSNSLIFFDT
jgi:hypothetical protein